MANEPNNETEDRPWERPGAVRYDCPPHRGDLLVFLGKFCLYFGALSFILHPMALFAMLGGLAVRQFASKDLDRIRAGQMDPAGEAPTLKARKSAEWGFILGFASLVFWGSLGLLFAYGIDYFDSHRQH